MAKVISLLAPAYSGSTLIGLILGSDGNITNVGEIRNIELDFNGSATCLCGETLFDCPFWSEIYADQKRSEHAGSWGLKFGRPRRREIDARPPAFFIQLALNLGISPRHFIKRKGPAYARDHDAFIRYISEFTGSEFVVDSSKNLLRYSAVINNSRLDIKYVVIDRKLSELVASRIKRAKKRRSWYSSFFVFIFLYLSIVNIYQLNRLRKTLDKDDIIKISLDEIIENHQGLEFSLEKWLGRRARLKINSKNELDLLGQHIFTGNRWIEDVHKNENRVKLKKDQGVVNFGKIEKIQLNIIRLLLDNRFSLR